MNIYKQLNEIIKYIENNLENKILNNDLAKILGTNEQAMQSVFSLLTNISIGEYIRNRRLTRAATDLIFNNEKIIDVAIKYQYSSPTTFSRTFEKFHNIKPSKIKSETFNNFPPLYFKENLIDVEEIKYRCEHIDKKTLYGVKKKMACKEIKNLAFQFWNDTELEYPELTNSMPSISVIEYIENFWENGCYYWIASEKENFDLEKIVIENSSFIVFTIYSLDYKKITYISEQAYAKYVPSINKEILDTVSLEVYYKDYIEIWMPVEN